MTQSFKLTTPAGMVLVNNPYSAGITHFETSTTGYLFLTGNIPTFATSGLAVAS